LEKTVKLKIKTGNEGRNSGDDERTGGEKYYFCLQLYS